MKGSFDEYGVEVAIRLTVDPLAAAAKSGP